MSSLWVGMSMLHGEKEEGSRLARRAGRLRAPGWRGALRGGHGGASR